MYKYFKFSIFGILTFLAGCCCYMLLLHIGILPAIGSIENYEEVNEVLLNLSYSYLAGLVFYLINDGIPSIIRRIRANRHIGKELREVQSQLNYITSLYNYIQTQNINIDNVIYVEVIIKRIKTSKEQKTIKIDIDIDNAIAEIRCHLETIESMLISCYLSSDTSMLLSELRQCLNYIENHKNNITRRAKIDILSRLSMKADNYYWFPEVHKFRTLTSAEASYIENRNRL